MRSNAQCTYTRFIAKGRQLATVCTVASHDEPAESNLNNPVKNHKPPCEDVDAAASVGIGSRVPFLLSYTTAEAGDSKDLAHALKTRGTPGDNFNINHGDEAAELNAESLHPFPMLAPFFGAELLPFDIPQESLGQLTAPFQNEPTSEPHEDLYYRRAAELIEFLERSQREGASLSKDLIAALLTPNNLAVGVETYFQHAYVHTPFIHKPSFSIETTDISLVLLIFVVGAIWSYPRDTYFMVLDTIELVERCIFEGEHWRKLQGLDAQEATMDLPGALPLLQAATLLVGISFGFPNAGVRRRFRGQRFNELMSIARLLKAGSTEGRLPSFVNAATPSDWSNYIVRESYNRWVHLQKLGTRNTESAQSVLLHILAGLSYLFALCNPSSYTHIGDAGPYAFRRLGVSCGIR